MDLGYPIRYQQGSLKLVDNKEKVVSQVRHLLDTLLGERLLSLDFGIDVTNLYSIPVTEVITEQIKLQLEAIQNLQTQIIVESYKNGKLTINIQIFFDDGDDTFLSVPIN